MTESEKAATKRFGQDVAEVAILQATMQSTTGCIICLDKGGGDILRVERLSHFLEGGQD